MGYTVLARKWRPKNFSELVGQSHVMQALANALDQQRLHHAYLFTGTRGVGKTTIARIFAKALNCQEGISSQPCGVCETCRSIDEGRFIDLIEVDAASKTKVDDTREILDNVQFAPTQGRYKVYLIDEVHMLSKSSFNALLKTLEEPPEHVKFLLATTDPHKLPITVLSRCLQFNLMRLTQLQIQTHLAQILVKESIPYEDSALALIAKSADGSARDSLSLLDQAIAYCAGQVMFEPVQTMLGLVDQQFGVAILNALAHEDPQEIKLVIQQLATMGVDYQALLSQLIESLHAISYVQLFGDNETTTLLPAEIVQKFAQSFTPERVQLLYQICLLTKQDMQLAPDIRIGFEMALMRMLAFMPADSSHASYQEGALANTVKPTGQTSQDLGSNLEGSKPLDALAGLATARSLVGKKKPELNEEEAFEKPLDESVQSVPVVNATEDSASHSKVKENFMVSQPENTEYEHANSTQTLENNEYKIDDNADNNAQVNSAQFNNATQALASDSSQLNQNDLSLQGHAHQQSDLGSVPNQNLASDQFEQAIAPEKNLLTPQDNYQQTDSVEVKHTDHLAQIRERLKQPFGKGKSAPLQTNDRTESKGVQQASFTQSQVESDLEKNSLDEGSKSQSVNHLMETVSSRLNEIPNSTNNTLESEFSNDNAMNAGFKNEPSYVNQQAEQQYEAPPWLQEEQVALHNAQQSFENNAQMPEPESFANVAQNSIPDSEHNTIQTPFEEHVKNQEWSSDEVPEKQAFKPSSNALLDWINIIERLDLKGMAADLANNSVMVELSEVRLAISIDPQQQYAKPEMYLEQIAQAVKDEFGASVELELVEVEHHQTPKKFYAEQETNRLLEAERSIQSDNLVQQFVSGLGMELIPGSIKPI